jgi:iron(II)-dependent oxidoreductase
MIEVPPTHRVASERLVELIDDARRRTYELNADLSGERLFGPNMSIVNPALWEVGHVGFFHDYFALRQLFGLDHFQRSDAERLYDSSAIPHDDRWALPLPTMDETWAYVDAVRDAMVARLREGTASEAISYVYQLTVLHEDMHAEAFTYTRQTLADPPPSLHLPQALPPAEPTGPRPGDIDVPGGEHVLGADESVPFRFDNEKQAHTVTVAPFSIARAPVTNAEFAEFVEAGGYERAELWSEAGWQWLQQNVQTAPRYWQRTDGGWTMRWFDRHMALEANRPVMHVNYYEAEAYCNWAGRRLPTEVEWEVAASRVPAAGGDALEPGKRLYPWGDTFPEPQRANLDGYRLDTVDVAALPDGDSALGCRQMLGNVWEWTSSTFAPYPGFAVDLYRDYSKPWFPEGRKVLRGGSWATRARLINNHHRNFFLPDRNDLYAGLRTCAL